MFYKVYYPNGEEKIHTFENNRKGYINYPPGLDKVFYKRSKGTYIYFQIIEMSEEEIWVEEITEEIYLPKITTIDLIRKNFVYFNLTQNYELIDY